jgi:hypothetical protein
MYATALLFGDGVVPINGRILDQLSPFAGPANFEGTDASCGSKPHKYSRVAARQITAGRLDVEDASVPGSIGHSQARANGAAI